MNSPSIALSEALLAVNVEPLWRDGLTGAGVSVGLIDTGVDVGSQALADRVEAFWSFDDEGRLTRGTPVDFGFHGTHTAGLICGGEVEGVCVGAAPNAGLRVVAALDGKREMANVLLALQQLQASGTRIIVLPFGVRSEAPIFQTAMRKLREAGVLVICPTGNMGGGIVFQPGANPKAFSVGAVDRYGNVTPYSSNLSDPTTGERTKPEIHAPGEAVSVGPKGDLLYLKGTSQACALAGGVAALLAQAAPDASMQQLREAIVAGAKGPNRVLNAAGALKRLRVGDSACGSPQTAPLDFGSGYIDPELRRVCLSGERKPIEAIASDCKIDLGADAGLDVQPLPLIDGFVVRAEPTEIWRLALTGEFGCIARAEI